MLRNSKVLYKLLVALAFFVCGAVNAVTNTVTYCVNPGWVPYEMVRNGKHVGISADYLRLIGDIAEIDFKFVSTQSWKESLEYIQADKCTIVPMLNDSANRKVYLDFTTPYLESPVVLVTRGADAMLQGFDGLNKQLVGVSSDSFLAGYLARYYPNVSLQLLDSEREGLRALNRGEIDIFTGSLLSVNAELNRMKYSDLYVTGYAEVFNLLRIGVSKGHSDLVQALNDAIGQIPEAAKVDIYRRWHSARPASEPDSRFAVLAIACFVVVLSTMLWRRRIITRYTREITQKNNEIDNLQSILIEKNRTLEFLSSHDPSSNLYNRNFMLHRADDEVSRFNRFNTAASMILFDFTSQYQGGIDGVECGLSDESMKALANVCLRCVREVDIAGRWGSEQIIILCPQTEIDAAKTLADRLKDAVDSHPREEIREVAYSIGVASLSGGESFNDWYERAARALFLSRREHSQQVMIAEQ